MGYKAYQNRAHAKRRDNAPLPRSGTFVVRAHAPTATHRFRWFAVEPTTGERIPRNRHMNGGDWGWDAVCSCGFDTRTGGAIQERIRDAAREHLWDVEHGFWTPEVSR